MKRYKTAHRLDKSNDGDGDDRRGRKEFSIPSKPNPEDGLVFRQRQEQSHTDYDSESDRTDHVRTDYDRWEQPGHRKHQRYNKVVEDTSTSGPNLSRLKQRKVEMFTSEEPNDRRRQTSTQERQYETEYRRDDGQRKRMTSRRVSTTNQSHQLTTTFKTGKPDETEPEVGKTVTKQKSEDQDGCSVTNVSVASNSVSIADDMTDTSSYADIKSEDLLDHCHQKRKVYLGRSGSLGKRRPPSKTSNRTKMFRVDADGTNAMEVGNSVVEDDDLTVGVAYGVFRVQNLWSRSPIPQFNRDQGADVIRNENQGCSASSSSSSITKAVRTTNSQGPSPSGDYITDSDTEQENDSQNQQTNSVTSQSIMVFPVAQVNTKSNDHDRRPIGGGKVASKIQRQRRQTEQFKGTSNIHIGDKDTDDSIEGNSVTKIVIDNEGSETMVKIDEANNSSHGKDKCQKTVVSIGDKSVDSIPSWVKGIKLKKVKRETKATRIRVKKANSTVESYRDDSSESILTDSYVESDTSVTTCQSRRCQQVNAIGIVDDDIRDYERLESETTVYSSNGDRKGRNMQPEWTTIRLRPVKNQAKYFEHKEPEIDDGETVVEKECIMSEKSARMSSVFTIGDTDNDKNVITVMDNVSETVWANNKLNEMPERKKLVEVNETCKSSNDGFSTSNCKNTSSNVTYLMVGDEDKKQSVTKHRHGQTVITQSWNERKEMKNRQNNSANENMKRLINEDTAFRSSNDAVTIILIKENIVPEDVTDEKISLSEIQKAEITVGTRGTSSVLNAVNSNGTNRTVSETKFFEDRSKNGIDDDTGSASLYQKCQNVNVKNKVKVSPETNRNVSKGSRRLDDTQLEEVVAVEWEEFDVTKVNSDARQFTKPVSEHKRNQKQSVESNREKISSFGSSHVQIRETPSPNFINQSINIGSTPTGETESKYNSTSNCSEYIDVQCDKTVSSARNEYTMSEVSPTNGVDSKVTDSDLKHGHKTTIDRSDVSNSKICYSVSNEVAVTKTQYDDQKCIDFRDVSLNHVTKNQVVQKTSKSMNRQVVKKVKFSDIDADERDSCNTVDYETAEDFTNGSKINTLNEDQAKETRTPVKQYVDAPFAVKLDFQALSDKRKERQIDWDTLEKINQNSGSNHVELAKLKSASVPKKETKENQEVKLKSKEIIVTATTNSGLDNTWSDSEDVVGNNKTYVSVLVFKQQKQSRISDADINQIRAGTSSGKTENTQLEISLKENTKELNNPVNARPTLDVVRTSKQVNTINGFETIRLKPVGLQQGDDVLKETVNVKLKATGKDSMELDCNASFDFKNYSESSTADTIKLKCGKSATPPVVIQKHSPRNDTGKSKEIKTNLLENELQMIKLKHVDTSKKTIENEPHEQINLKPTCVISKEPSKSNLRAVQSEDTIISGNLKPTGTHWEELNGDESINLKLHSGSLTADNMLEFDKSATSHVGIQNDSKRNDTGKSKEIKANLLENELQMIKLKPVNTSKKMIKNERREQVNLKSTFVISKEPSKSNLRAVQSEDTNISGNLKPTGKDWEELNYNESINLKPHSGSLTVDTMLEFDKSATSHVGIQNDSKRPDTAKSKGTTKATQFENELQMIKLKPVNASKKTVASEPRDTVDLKPVSVISNEPSKSNLKEVQSGETIFHIKLKPTGKDWVELNDNESKNVENNSGSLIADAMLECGRTVNPMVEVQKRSPTLDTGKPNMTPPLEYEMNTIKLKPVNASNKVIENDPREEVNLKSISVISNQPSKSNLKVVQSEETIFNIKLKPTGKDWVELNDNESKNVENNSGSLIACGRAIKPPVETQKGLPTLDTGKPNMTPPLEYEMNTIKLKPVNASNKVIENDPREEVNLKSISVISNQPSKSNLKVVQSEETIFNIKLKPTGKDWVELNDNESKNVENNSGSLIADAMLECGRTAKPSVGTQKGSPTLDTGKPNMTPPLENELNMIKLKPVNASNKVIANDPREEAHLKSIFFVRNEGPKSSPKAMYLEETSSPEKTANEFLTVKLKPVTSASREIIDPLFIKMTRNQVEMQAEKVTKPQFEISQSTVADDDIYEASKRVKLKPVNSEIYDKTPQPSDGIHLNNAKGKKNESENVAKKTTKQKSKNSASEQNELDSITLKSINPKKFEDAAEPFEQRKVKSPSLKKESRKDMTDTRDSEIQNVEKEFLSVKLRLVDANRGRTPDKGSEVLIPNSVKQVNNQRSKKALENINIESKESNVNEIETVKLKPVVLEGFKPEINGIDSSTGDVLFQPLAIRQQKQNVIAEDKHQRECQQPVAKLNRHEDDGKKYTCPLKVSDEYDWRQSAEKIKQSSINWDSLEKPCNVSRFSLEEMRLRPVKCKDKENVPNQTSDSKILEWRNKESQGSCEIMIKNEEIKNPSSNSRNKTLANEAKNDDFDANKELVDLKHILMKRNVSSVNWNELENKQKTTNDQTVLEAVILKPTRTNDGQLHLADTEISTVSNLKPKTVQSEMDFSSTTNGHNDKVDSELLPTRGLPKNESKLVDISNGQITMELTEIIKNKRSNLEVVDWDQLDKSSRSTIQVTDSSSMNSNKKDNKERKNDKIIDNKPYYCNDQNILLHVQPQTMLSAPDLPYIRNSTTNINTDSSLSNEQNLNGYLSTNHTKNLNKSNPAAKTTEDWISLSKAKQMANIDWNNLESSVKYSKDEVEEAQKRDDVRSNSSDRDSEEQRKIRNVNKNFVDSSKNDAHHVPAEGISECLVKDKFRVHDDSTVGTSNIVQKNEYLRTDRDGKRMIVESEGMSVLRKQLTTVDTDVNESFNLRAQITALHQKGKTSIHKENRTMPKNHRNDIKKSQTAESMSLDDTATRDASNNDENYQLAKQKGLASFSNADWEKLTQRKINNVDWDRLDKPLTAVRNVFPDVKLRHVNVEKNESNTDVVIKVVDQEPTEDWLTKVENIDRAKIDWESLEKQKLHQSEIFLNAKREQPERTSSPIREIPVRERNPQMSDAVELYDQTQIVTKKNLDHYHQQYSANNLNTSNSKDSLNSLKSDYTAELPAVDLRASLKILAEKKQMAAIDWNTFEEKNSKPSNTKMNPVIDLKKDGEFLPKSKNELGLKVKPLMKGKEYIQIERTSDQMKNQDGCSTNKTPEVLTKKEDVRAKCSSYSNGVMKEVKESNISSITSVATDLNKIKLKKVKKDTDINNVHQNRAVIRRPSVMPDEDALRDANVPKVNLRHVEINESKLTQSEIEWLEIAQRKVNSKIDWDALEKSTSLQTIEDNSPQMLLASSETQQAKYSAEESFVSDIKDAETGERESIETKGANQTEKMPANSVIESSGMFEMSRVAEDVISIEDSSNINDSKNNGRLEKDVSQNKENQMIRQKQETRNSYSQDFSTVSLIQSEPIEYNAKSSLHLADRFELTKENSKCDIIHKDEFTPNTRESKPEFLEVSSQSETTAPQSLIKNEYPHGMNRKLNSCVTEDKVTFDSKNIENRNVDASSRVLCDNSAVSQSIIETEVSKNIDEAHENEICSKLAEEKTERTIDRSFDLGHSQSHTSGSEIRNNVKQKVISDVVNPENLTKLKTSSRNSSMDDESDHDVYENFVIRPINTTIQPDGVAAVHTTSQFIQDHSEEIPFEKFQKDVKVPIPLEDLFEHENDKKGTKEKTSEDAPLTGDDSTVDEIANKEMKETPNMKYTDMSTLASRQTSEMMEWVSLHMSKLTDTAMFSETNGSLDLKLPEAGVIQGYADPENSLDLRPQKDDYGYRFERNSSLLENVVQKWVDGYVSLDVDRDINSRKIVRNDEQATVEDFVIKDKLGSEANLSILAEKEMVIYLPEEMKNNVESELKCIVSIPTVQIDHCGKFMPENSVELAGDPCLKSRNLCYDWIRSTMMQNNIFIRHSTENVIPACRQTESGWYHLSPIYEVYCDVTIEANMSTAIKIPMNSTYCVEVYYSEHYDDVLSLKCITESKFPYLTACQTIQTISDFFLIEISIVLVFAGISVTSKTNSDSYLYALSPTDGDREYIKCHKKRYFDVFANALRTESLEKCSNTDAILLSCCEMQRECNVPFSQLDSGNFVLYGNILNVECNRATTFIYENDPESLCRVKRNSCRTPTEHIKTPREVEFGYSYETEKTCEQYRNLYSSAAELILQFSPLQICFDSGHFLPCDTEYKAVETTGVVACIELNHNFAHVVETTSANICEDIAVFHECLDEIYPLREENTVLQENIYLDTNNMRIFQSDSTKSVYSQPGYLYRARIHIVVQFAAESILWEHSYFTETFFDSYRQEITMKLLAETQFIQNNNINLLNTCELFPGGNISDIQLEAGIRERFTVRQNDYIKCAFRSVTSFATSQNVEFLTCLPVESNQTENIYPSLSQARRTDGKIIKRQCNNCKDELSVDLNFTDAFCSTASTPNYPLLEAVTFAMTSVNAADIHSHQIFDNALTLDQSPSTIAHAECKFALTSHEMENSYLYSVYANEIIQNIENGEIVTWNDGKVNCQESSWENHDTFYVQIEQIVQFNECSSLDMPILTTEKLNSNFPEVNEAALLIHPYSFIAAKTIVKTYVPLEWRTEWDHEEEILSRNGIENAKDEMILNYLQLTRLNRFRTSFFVQQEIGRFDQELNSNSPITHESIPLENINGQNFVIGHSDIKVPSESVESSIVLKTCGSFENSVSVTIQSSSETITINNFVDEFMEFESQLAQNLGSLVISPMFDCWPHVTMKEIKHSNDVVNVKFHVVEHGRTTAESSDIAHQSRTCTEEGNNRPTEILQKSKNNVSCYSVNSNFNFFHGDLLDVEATQDDSFASLFCTTTCHVKDNYCREYKSAPLLPIPNITRDGENVLFYIQIEYAINFVAEIELVSEELLPIDFKLNVCTANSIFDSFGEIHDRLKITKLNACGICAEDILPIESSKFHFICSRLNSKAMIRKSRDQTKNVSLESGKIFRELSHAVSIVCDNGQYNASEILKCQSEPNVRRNLARDFDDKIPVADIFCPLKTKSFAAVISDSPEDEFSECTETREISATVVKEINVVQVNLLLSFAQDQILETKLISCKELVTKSPEMRLSTIYFVSGYSTAEKNYKLVSYAPETVIDQRVETINSECLNEHNTCSEYRVPTFEYILCVDGNYKDRQQHNYVKTIDRILCGSKMNNDMGNDSQFASGWQLSSLFSESSYEFIASCSEAFCCEIIRTNVMHDVERFKSNHPVETFNFESTLVNSNTSNNSVPVQIDRVLQYTGTVTSFPKFNDCCDLHTDYSTTYIKCKCPQENTTEYVLDEMSVFVHCTSSLSSSDKCNIC
ncbi:Uncharacterised protein g7638 [Pycnogonum litorale]